MDKKTSGMNCNSSMKHNIIVFIQEKRSEWIKRERDSTKTLKSTHREVLFVDTACSRYIHVHT